MDRHGDDRAPAPAYNLLGRLGSWHSNRWLFFVGGLFAYLVVPWHSVPSNRMTMAIQINVAAGLLWAVPTWYAGVVARRHGVTFNYGGVTRTFAWDQIQSASVAWHGVDPRLRIDLVDGREVWAPGFRIPLSQRSSRQDGWRSTEMFRAAELISAEAELRRQPPPDDGLLDLAPARARLRPAIGTAA